MSSPVSTIQRHDLVPARCHRNQSGSAERRRSSRSSSTASLAAWMLLGGLFVAATACASSSSSSNSSSGGATTKGGAAGKGGSSAQAGVAPGDGGAAPQGGSPDAGGAAAAQGGAAGNSASAGAAGAQPPPPVCTMPANWVGKITKPSPLISVGKPTFTNSTEPANMGLINDGKYKIGSGLVFSPSPTSSTYASIKVGSGYTKLLLVWQDASNGADYGLSGYSGFTPSGSYPSDYLVKVSNDSTNGDDGTWTTVATVAGNQVRGRSHVFDFTGMSWVRFEVTANPLAATGAMRVARIDEIELHDHSANGSGDYADSFFIMGDSITKMSFDRKYGANELDKRIAAQRPAYAPALVEAGNGGEKLTDALRHLKTENWLSLSEGMKFVTLAYGTNDTWGQAASQAVAFENSLRPVIQFLLDNDRVPILVRIPWSTVTPQLPAFNAVIDKLQQEYGLPCGPDLYGWFSTFQDQISGDGVHPASAGLAQLPRLYAEDLLPLYPSP